MNSWRALKLIVLCYALLACSPVWAATPVATGQHAAVATISEPASRAALQILRQGGNAIDAAVAAAAVLGVTDPFSCGIGGGGFMLIYSAKENRVISIDHREAAPAAFTPQVFTRDGKVLPWAEAVPMASRSASPAPCAAGTKPCIVMAA